MLVEDARTEAGWTRNAAARVVEAVACSADCVGAGRPGLDRQLATDGPVIGA